ncbi:MAG: hypothetical protein FJZ49_07885 [Candidatus Verstraetearchaeota archaeon]|nr:hypothetical protein [Candidatus Verstraetearchaeota archaeon]
MPRVNWKALDEQLERGELTLEECVQRQFSMVNVPEEVIINELEKVVRFRPTSETSWTTASPAACPSPPSAAGWTS